MRPKKHETTGSGSARGWTRSFVDGEIAPLYSDSGRPGIATQFVIGLFCSSIFTDCPTKACANAGSMDPYFQHFTGEEFFRHEFPHQRSDLSHWRKRLGGKLELLLAESLRVASSPRGHGRARRARSRASGCDASACSCLMQSATRKPSRALRLTLGESVLIFIA
jgi:hypothetical protein